MDLDEDRQTVNSTFYAYGQADRQQLLSLLKVTHQSVQSVSELFTTGHTCFSGNWRRGEEKEVGEEVK